MARRSPEAADRQRDPERTRRRILDAALTEFAANGYAGARVGSIATRAGVNKQLISYYFGGKAGLYHAVTTEWFAGEVAAADTQREMTLVELATSYLSSDRERARLMFWEALSPVADDPGKDARDARMRAALDDLRRRQADGEVASEIDPACLLVAAMAAASVAVVLPQHIRSLFGVEPDSPEFTQRYADQFALIIERIIRPNT